jgi:superfamily I DNA and RNA helicase-like protein
MIQKLYTRPYFAHIELQEQGYDGSEHFYLSDNESFNEVISIGQNGHLVPFKLDKERPITSALFHCYQSKHSDEVRYWANGDELVFLTLLICDDEIRNRELLNVMQLFPEQDAVSVNADELLEQILQENRSNPMLRNIIATLQQQQFRIIETDVDKSFVVQGCAGSGKSQCLFHRLLFLRDVLSEDGWNHVLLLTPTQLFRNYSADLIRRYQLSDINDCSISELYRSLLNRYDSRFRNRQYKFELSEEYLPDGYLETVYDPVNIVRIDAEIDRAVAGYVEAGCRALGIPMPKTIDADVISLLVEQLGLAIGEFDSTESVLQQDPEYIEQRSRYEKARKALNSLQQSISRLTKEHEVLINDETETRKLLEEWGDAVRERTEWIEQRKKCIETADKALAHFDKGPGEDGGAGAPAQYMHQLYVLRDLTEGRSFKDDEEYLLFLDNEFCAQAEQELKKKVGDQSADQFLDDLIKRKKTIENHIASLTQDSIQKTEAVIQLEEWLRSKASQYEGEKSTRTLRRADMERARYFLSRIESSVFEQEVWKALAPEKEQYGIPTVDIEDLGENRRRETRILYKSDLLFYVKLYYRLHGLSSLPRYTLLCIDEGQDLHQADYEMLQTLFPDAAFNVFGDTDQVLHTAYGISNWQQETGIDMVFSLDRNYRNEASIVEFCNRKFGCTMKYIGQAREKRMPKELGNIREILPILNEKNVAVIVNDRSSFDRLHKMIGNMVSLEFLDTNSDSLSDDRIPCYSIFAAKGLEFPVVLVISDDMTNNQRIVACTRATERLYYYE